MNGKITLEDHITTEENNKLWDSTGEAARNGKEFMNDRQKIGRENAKRLLRLA